MEFENLVSNQKKREKSECGDIRNKSAEIVYIHQEGHIETRKNHSGQNSIRISVGVVVIIIIVPKPKKEG